MSSVPAEIDTGPPKSRKAPPELVTLGRGRSLDAFRTNQLVAQLKPSGKCFRCQVPALARRAFIAILTQEFGDCLSSTIAPSECLTPWLAHIAGAYGSRHAPILPLPKG
jgi:hypothetical protein